jgi:hypothetical protein
LAEHAAGRNVTDAQLDQVTAPQLGVQGAVEQGQVANPIGILELLANGPNVLGFERRFRPNYLA